MIPEICRALLPMLACAHLSLLLWTIVPELTVCSGMALPAASVVTDVTIARERAARGSYFNAAALVELLGMAAVVFGSSKRSMRHDLAGKSRWLPALMIVTNMSCRARFVYSTPHDAESCRALNCPTTPYSAQLPGCQAASGVDAFYIDWNDRENWCPMPRWYREQPYAAALCGGLVATPDVASCYRYGCSAMTSGRYNSVKVLIWSSLLFSILALVPYTTADYNPSTPEESVELQGGEGTPEFEDPQYHWKFD